MVPDVPQLLLPIGLALIAFAGGYGLGCRRRRSPLTDPALVRELGSLRAAEIELYVQPILLVANPGKFGLEILPRCRSPRLRSLDTRQLRAFARQQGLAARLDQLMIQRLPGLEAELSRQPLSAASIDHFSFNISGESLASNKALEGLMAQLREHHINHRGFTLEISETAANQKLEGITTTTPTAAERIHRELGVRVCIDEFGSGFSSFRRIAEAWYDAIKLDRELVQDLHGSFRLQRFLGAFLGSAHSLGKVVGVEGVAEYRDLVAAIRLGADALQGPLIGEPMLAAEFPLFLEHSPWADGGKVQQVIAPLRSAQSQQERSRNNDRTGNLSLERYILENWAGLRSFEEFVLLFVNELRSWGLDTMRMSLAFLPDHDDVDCFQYIWYAHHPGEVETLCMGREFLENPEHLASPLYYLASRADVLRQRLDTPESPDFPFLRSLQERGATDYLGIRLESRGVSIPVLTIALQGESRFSDVQIQRIESLSALLSLLFHSFESERAKRLALLDPLTQLANRRSFDSFLMANVAASRMTGRHLALLLLDIDHFKDVNDTYGHAHGDHCLRQLAGILTTQLRQQRDFLARLGGEEFAVILLDNNAEQVQAIAERLRLSVAAVPISNARLDPSQSHFLTVSIGGAIWEASSGVACEADDLQHLADDCLYEAKRRGRNRVMCHRLDEERPPGLDRESSPGTSAPRSADGASS
jgi:diguanylate cyclase (GGDEF)-like protein